MSKHWKHRTRVGDNQLSIQRTGTGLWHFADLDKKPLGFGNENNRYAVALCGVYFQLGQRDVRDPTCQKCLSHFRQTGSGQNTQRSVLAKLAKWGGYKGTRIESTHNGLGSRSITTAFLEVFRFSENGVTKQQIPIKQIYIMRFLPPQFLTNDNKIGNKEVL